MKVIVSNSSRLDVIPALEANMEEAFCLIARHAPGGEVIETPKILRFSTGVHHQMANGVFRARFTKSEAAREVQAALDHFKALNVPMMWVVTPSSKPSDLGELLVSQGATRRNSSPAMAASLLTLPPMPALPNNTRIKEVHSAEAQLVWSEVVSEASRIPAEVGTLFKNVKDTIGYDADASMRNFLATQHGVPVATSTLLLSAGVAGIYCVATVEAARRQGLGEAMTLAPLLVARDLGYKVGVLQASSMGLPIYRRLGFEEFFSIDAYTYNVTG